jgi:hypothetical protein
MVDHRDPTIEGTFMRFKTSSCDGLAALSTSETSMPFQVGNGRVTFSDTSETTAPIAVNGP